MPKLKTVAQRFDAPALGLAEIGGAEAAAAFSGTEDWLASDVSFQNMQFNAYMDGLQSQLDGVISQMGESDFSAVDGWLRGVLTGTATGGSFGDIPSGASPLSAPITVGPEVLRLARLMADMDTAASNRAAALGLRAVAAAGRNLTANDATAASARVLSSLGPGSLNRTFQEMLNTPQVDAKSLKDQLESSLGVSDFNALVDAIRPSIVGGGDVDLGVDIGLWFAGGKGLSVQGVASVQTVANLGGAVMDVMGSKPGVERGMAVASAVTGAVMLGLQLAALAGSAAAASAVPIAGWVVAAVLAIVTAVLSIVLKRKAAAAAAAVKAEIAENKALLVSLTPRRASFKAVVRERQSELVVQAAKVFDATSDSTTRLQRMYSPPGFSEERTFLREDRSYRPVFDDSMPAPDDSFIGDSSLSNMGFVPSLGQSLSTLYLSGAALLYDANNNGSEERWDFECDGRVGADKLVCQSRQPINRISNVGFGGQEMALLNKLCCVVDGTIRYDWSLLYRADFGSSLQRQWYEWLGDLFAFVLPVGGYVTNLKWTSGERARQVAPSHGPFSTPPRAANWGLDGMYGTPMGATLEYTHESAYPSQYARDTPRERFVYNRAFMPMYIGADGKQHGFLPYSFRGTSYFRLQSVYDMLYPPTSPSSIVKTMLTGSGTWQASSGGPAIRTGRAAGFDYHRREDFQYFPTHAWNNAIGDDAVVGVPRMVADLRNLASMQEQLLFRKATRGRLRGVPFLGESMFSVDPDNTKEFPWFAGSGQTTPTQRRQQWQDGVSVLLAVPGMKQRVALADVANPGLRGRMADLGFKPYLTKWERAKGVPLSIVNAVNTGAKPDVNLPGGPAPFIPLPLYFDPREPEPFHPVSAALSTSRQGTVAPAVMLAGGVTLGALLLYATRRDRRKK